MPKENYSENDIAQIFKRAAELESKQSNDFDSVGGGHGLSLDELSQIAVDAGLDPENVRRAANEISPSPQSDSQTVAVQNNEVISEQWVAGEFTDELADLVIADLNHRYNTTHKKTNWKDNILHDASTEPNRQSNVSRTGKSLEWKKFNKREDEEIRVLIQPRNERIRIRVIRQASRGNGLTDSNFITGFLPYIPYLTAVAMLFSLPNSYLVNSIIAIITFAVLQFAVIKNSGWIEKYVSGSENHALENDRLEVQSLAQGLANLVKPPDSGDQLNDVQFIDNAQIRDVESNTPTKDSNKTRNRSH